MSARKAGILHSVSYFRVLAGKSPEKKELIVSDFKFESIRT
jgi:hypothetical protein